MPQIGIGLLPAVIRKSDLHVAQDRASGNIGEGEFVVDNEGLVTNPVAQRRETALHFPQLPALPLSALLFSLLLEEEQDASVAHAISDDLHLLCKQLVCFVLGVHRRILWGRIMGLKPFEDEVGFVDRRSIVWNEDWQFLKGIVEGRLRCAVPWDFGLELEWDPFLGKGDADFARVWGPGSMSISRKDGTRLDLRRSRYQFETHDVLG